MKNKFFFKNKYLKYKSKYLNIKLNIQRGGADVEIGDKIYSIFDFDFNIDSIKDEDHENYFFNERDEHGSNYVYREKDSIDKIKLLGTVIIIKNDENEPYIILDNDLTFFLNSYGFLWFNLDKEQQHEYDTIEEHDEGRSSFFSLREENPKLNFLKKIRSWSEERNVIENIWPNSLNVGDLFFDQENNFVGHITKRNDDNINYITKDGISSVYIEYDELDKRRSDLYTVVPFRDVYEITNLIPRLADGDLEPIQGLIDQYKGRRYYNKCSKYCPGCELLTDMETKIVDEEKYSYILQTTQEPLWHTLPCKNLRGIQNKLKTNSKDEGRYNLKLLAFVTITKPLGYKIVKSSYTPREIEFKENYDIEWGIVDVQIDTRLVEEKRKALALKSMLSSAEIGYNEIIEILPQIGNEALQKRILDIIHNRFHKPK
jgi:hypothetical protein